MKFIYTISLVFLYYYVKQSYSANCTFKDEPYMTDVTRQFVVAKHNDLRRGIANGTVLSQPKASDMKEMFYDINLEALAVELVKTCIYAHMQFTDSRWAAVGQNLYIWKGSSDRPYPDWDRAIQRWYDEQLMYTYPIKQSGTGHYTQVVNANSTCLGCAYSYYYNHENTTMPYQKLYACNYGPAGNYVGRPPYNVGPGCDNLCVPQPNLCSGI